MIKVDSTLSDGSTFTTISYVKLIVPAPVAPSVTDMEIDGDIGEIIF